MIATGERRDRSPWIGPGTARAAFALFGAGAVVALVAALRVRSGGVSAMSTTSSASPSSRVQTVLVETARAGAPASGGAELTTPSSAGPDAPARATACALASLSPIERGMLRSALEDLATRIEARANPMAEDLGDGVPEEELTRAAQHFLPTFTAARSLTAGEWPSEDGRLMVRAVRACDPASRCVRLYDHGARTPDEQRARFFAWPLAAAAILRAPDGAVAARVAEGLRMSTPRGTSRIALVLSGRDLRGGEDAEARAIREQARRVLRFARGAGGQGTRALMLLAADPVTVPLAPYLSLADEEILVVPRMGALSEGAAFADEVSARITPLEAKEHLTWVQAPAPVVE